MSVITYAPSFRIKDGNPLSSGSQIYDSGQVNQDFYHIQSGCGSVLFWKIHYANYGHALHRFFDMLLSL